MAECAIYEEAAHFGNDVSHFHGRSNRIRKVNIKSVEVEAEGSVRKMYICTSYLRSNFVERA